MIEVSIQCTLCTKIIKINVTREALTKFKAGEGYVQEIFPELSRSECEMFISRICEGCWNKIFGGKK